MSSTTRIRKRWTEEEDMILRREADAQLSEGPLRDWNRIAAKLRGRTNKDCRKRWSKVCENVKKGAWSPEEDQQLRAAVERFGAQWTYVAQSVRTRHADQCAKRWTHSLDPDLDRSQWVPEDNRRLLDAVARYGRNWSIIVKNEFPARSPTDIKNQYVIVERKQQQALEASKSSSASVTSEPEIPSMIHPDYAEMGIDARPESRRGYSEEDSFERLGGTGFSLGTSSGGDCLSIPTPLSLDAAPPSLNFSTPHFSNFSMEESNHLFDETHSTPFEQQTSTFLPDNTDFDLNHTWDTDSFFTHNGIDPSSTDIDSRLQPRLALGSNDFRNACGNSTDGGASGKRNTLILEDLYPETVNDVMAAMFKSNTKFKMRLYSQD